MGFFCAMVGDVPIATTFAQMAMPWAWLAAMVGLFRSWEAKQAALDGLLVLLTANLTYFVVRVAGRMIVTGQIDGSDVRFVILWSAICAVVGPAAALLGQSTRSDRSAVVGVALLSAGSVAEPPAWWWHVDRPGPGTAYLIVALVGITFLVIRFFGQRVRIVASLLLVALMVYPIAMGIEAALIVTDQVSKPFRLM